MELLFGCLTQVRLSIFYVEITLSHIESKHLSILHFRSYRIIRNAAHISRQACMDEYNSTRSR